MPGRTCRKFRGLFTAYLQQELASVPQSQMEDHLAQCETCREELHRVRNAVRSLRLVDPVPVPEGLRGAVQARLSASSRGPIIPSRESRSRGLKWAVGFLFLGVGLGWWWWGHSPGPREKKDSLKAPVSASVPFLPQELQVLPSGSSAENSLPESPGESASSLAKRGSTAMEALHPRKTVSSSAGPWGTDSPPPFPAGVPSPRRSPASRADPSDPGERTPIDPLSYMLQRAKQGGISTGGVAGPNPSPERMERPRGRPRSLDPLPGERSVSDAMREQPRSLDSLEEDPLSGEEEGSEKPGKAMAEEEEERGPEAEEREREEGGGEEEVFGPGAERE